MNCIHCGRTFSVVYTDIGLFVGCPWCGTPVLFNFIQMNFASQCFRCGMMISGPLQGVRVITSDEEPDLSFAQSHGLCVDCKDVMLSEFYLSRENNKKKYIA